LSPDIVEAIAGWPGAQWLRTSGLAYPFVNAAHILGIGLLLGSILPLDLRLLGLFNTVPLRVIGPFLSRAAASGIILAAPTGLWLFSVQPGDYLGNPAFRWKAGLLVLAIGNIVAQHLGPQYRVAVSGGRVGTMVRVHAAASVGLWLSVLIAGRWIGFV
jgi:hypothetical protein